MIMLQSCKSMTCMNFNSRLSASAHTLLQLADASQPVTIEALGKKLSINFNVLRQNMAALREAGLVRSDGSQNARWALARAAEDINLGDVYAALGKPALFVVRNRGDAGACVVETSVDEALAAAFSDAENALMARLTKISLAELSLDAQWHE